MLHSKLRSAALAGLLSIAGLPVATAQTVEIELLSKAPTGLTPAGGSRGPWSKAMSGDGRFVLFQSAGPDLFEGQVDRNGDYDVFLLDREANSTSLVSHRAGHPAIAVNGGSGSALLSRNGRFVAFASAATDLVAGLVDDNQWYDTFLFDRQDGSVRLASRLPASPSSTPGSSSYPVDVSDTGWVLFYSESNQFVANDTPDSGDAFLFDPTTERVRLVSHVPGDPQRRPASGASIPLALSSDGRWTLYQGSSEGLDAALPAPAYTQHVYLYDRDTDSSRVISRTSTGELANAWSDAVALTPDGAYALFTSVASNLSALHDDDHTRDVFVYERASGTVHSLSVGVPFQDGRAPHDTFPVGISDDGQRVLLRRGIGPPFDPWPYYDVPYDHAYLLDRREGAVRLVSHFNGETAASLGGVEVLAISGDGSGVLYSSPVSPIRAEGDANRELQMYLYEIASFESRLVSGVDGTTRRPTGQTAYAQISADGSLVLLHSNAIDLVSNLPDNNGYVDLFTHDLRTGSTQLCGRGTGTVVSTPLSWQQRGDAMTPDGRGVAISGYGLVPGPPIGLFSGSEPFYLDRARPSITALAPRVARGSGSTTVQAIGADVAVLSSSAVRLGDAIVDRNNASDVFLAALDGSRLPRLLSRSTSGAGQTANGHSLARAITPSGRFVLFDSHATDLVAGVVDTNQSSDVFVFDRETETIDLVSSVADDANRASGSAESVAISADGRWVLLRASQPSLVAGGRQPIGGANDVYLVDRELGSARMISHSAGDPTHGGNGYSYPAALTPDGRWALFRSSAPDLIARQQDSNGVSDVFVHDRQSGTNRLVSHEIGIPLAAANGTSVPAAMTDDGRYVLFHSTATTLGQAFDSNDAYDVYRHDAVTGTNRLISSKRLDYGIATGDGHSFGEAMSRDGKRILFSSEAADLVPGVRDVNRRSDAFLFDSTLERIALLSASARTIGSTGDARTFASALTADGSGALLTSEASDLVDAVDVNRSSDVFFVELDFSSVFATGFEGGSSP